MKGYNKGLHRFAFFTACCTFLLIIAGGLVTSTQSGLSVPDWPTTYGHFMFAYPLDQMVGGIFYEHSHRMIASVVGFLTVILAMWMWRKEDRRWVRNLSYVALGTVILQGVLGGLTVLLMLPTAISVSHATLAQTFFAIVVTLALITSKWWRSDQPLLQREGKKNSLPQLILITAFAVYIQLILGALMRHTHSGLVVPDFPLAYGQLFPSLSPEAMDQYNQQLIQSDIRIAADGAVTQGQIIIHMLHRFWAVITAIFIAWTAVRLLKLSSQSKRLARLGYVLFGLIVLQIALGALTVLSLKAVDVTTAHVATGALLLVTCVLASFHSIKLSGKLSGKLFGIRTQHQTAVSFSPGEVSA
ncbi:MAG: COX15/CtaA family protein [Ignavibacteria bacterium]|nr:COX15/CtaA family protein [Ignavibacteria bacterium]